MSLLLLVSGHGMLQALATSIGSTSRYEKTQDTGSSSSSLAASTLASVRGACESDIQQLCPGVPSTGLRACITQNMMWIGAPCRFAIRAFIRYHRPRNGGGVSVDDDGSEDLYESEWNDAMFAKAETDHSSLFPSSIGIVALTLVTSFVLVVMLTSACILSLKFWKRVRKSTPHDSIARSQRSSPPSAGHRAQQFFKRFNNQRATYEPVPTEAADDDDSW